MEEYNPVRKKAGECIMKELELLSVRQEQGENVSFELSSLLSAAKAGDFLRSECIRPMTPAEKEARLQWVEEQAASIAAGKKKRFHISDDVKFWLGSAGIGLGITAFALLIAWLCRLVKPYLIS